MTARRPATSNLLSANQAVLDALGPLGPADRQRVLASVMSLLGISPITAPSENSDPSAPIDARPAPDSRPLSLGELFAQKQPVTNPQRLAVFAYYREKYERKPRFFARPDLRPYFAQVREKDPGTNYDREFKKALKLVYIHEDGTKSYLTSTGLSAVEVGFGGKARPRGKTANTSKRKRNP